MTRGKVVWSFISVYTHQSGLNYGETDYFYKIFICVASKLGEEDIFAMEEDFNKPVGGSAQDYEDQPREQP